MLEWVARPSSRGSSPPRDRTHVAFVSFIGRQVLLPLVPPGKRSTLGGLDKSCPQEAALKLNFEK